MTPPEALKAAEERLRKAVQAGTHDRAKSLLLGYRRQLEETLGGLPPGGAESGEVLREAQALLEWARRTALISRASAATRLARLPRPLLAYRSAPARPKHTWELHG
jgi:hypothetical protein